MERWKFVKDNHLCFSCLHAGHSSIKCNNRRQCGLMKCTKYHNRLLHKNINFFENKNNNRNAVKCQNDGDGTLGMAADDSDGTLGMVAKNSDGTLKKIDESDNKDNTLVTTIIGSSLSKKTLFKFVPMQLRGPSGFVNVIAFVDDGSKISLFEEDVAKQIGLQGPKSNLSLGWIGGKTSNIYHRK